MKQSETEKKVSEIISPVIEDMGFRLVWARIAVNDQGKTLQVTAEDPQTRQIGVEDCARISRAISAILDVEDPIEGKYNLEVSSPGIDRMLYTEKDYRDFAGFEAKIELEAAINGQRRYRGIIKGMDDGDAVIESEEKEYRLPVDEVRKAKLVLTDDLIAATSENNAV
jgi:ribosome maturation factor RimP